ncbi:MAG TPA: hypothetical protein VHB51_01445 [Candidatus Saccharimonadales bacterium]|nr:hypothetical protein [Candidatus Saccharimonadales bacterium]
MINLLSPELKSAYAYGRRNVILRRWVVVLVLALLGLGALGTYGSLRLHRSTVDAQAAVTAANARLEKEHLNLTKNQVQDISNSLKLAVQVLSREVLFSKLITQIGAAMPVGTNLTGLNINQVSGGLDLEAEATNYTTATQVQVNLTDPKNKIFASADINRIDCGGSSSTANPGFPCTISLRALFNATNQFLFINQGGQQ